MGLISTKAEVTLNSRNIVRLRNLGYSVPANTHWKKEAIKINVKIEDLSIGSCATIEWKCDCLGCTTITKETYKKYMRRKRGENGEIYCNYHSYKISRSGENNGNFNPNITQEEREDGRKIPQYNEFIKKVLARDNYTCQCCGKYRHDLEVHHLNGYSWFEQGRIDETNAITLCHNCHTNYHNIYGCKNANKEDFLEWIKDVELNLNKYDGEIPNIRWMYCIETKSIIKNPRKLKSYNGLKACCLGNLKSYKGKHYMYYDVFNTMDENDILNYIIRCLKTKDNYICLETMKIYTKISLIPNFTPNDRKNISRCCNKGTETLGGFHWRYLSDYLIENNCNLQDYYNFIENIIYEKEEE